MAIGVMLSVGLGVVEILIRSLVGWRVCKKELVWLSNFDEK